jgi:hypothetical protein
LEGRVKREAAIRSEIEDLLNNGYVLVYVCGWWWLLNGNDKPVKANCGSVNAILRDPAVELVECDTLKSWQRS